MQKERGFTLIELMIAVAIIGILAAIAVPQYNSYLIRSKQGAAKAALLDIAQKQAQFLVDNRGYAADKGTLGWTTPSDLLPFYAFSIPASANAPPSFIAKATPLSASAGTLWFSIDQAGQKLTGATGSATATGTW